MYNFGSVQRAREIVGNRQKDSQGGRRAGGDFCGCPPPRKYNRSPLDIGYTSQARHTTHTRPRRAAKAQVYLGAGRSSRLTPSAPGGRKRVQGARVLAGRGQSPGGSAETQLIPPRGRARLQAARGRSSARTKTAPVVARARASARVRSSDNRAPSNTLKHKMPPKPTPNRS